MLIREVGDVMGYLVLLVLGGFFFVVPFALCWLEFWYLVMAMVLHRHFEEREGDPLQKRVKNRWRRMTVVDGLSLGLGFFFSSILLYELPEYDEAFWVGESYINAHTPISWDNGGIGLILLWLVGVAGIFLTSHACRKTLPPLLTVLALGANVLGIVVMTVYLVQLTTFEGGIMLLLFPLAHLLCAVRSLVLFVWHYTEQHLPKQDEIPSKVQFYAAELLRQSAKWMGLAVLGALPLLLICTVILLLCGQRPDAFIRAFTQTSDWRLSQQIAPPDLVYDAHYLCTVSLRGHRRLVRPLRYGIRQNHRIVVNRQLMAANAFEDLLMERTPRFHRLVRSLYDRYGYPVARHIRSAWSADVVYLLMKPLEWLFVAVLYLCDVKPENRIAVQYLPWEFQQKVREARKMG